jgi:hypothetical protein
MATMKLPPCTKCQGRLTAEKDTAGLVFEVVVRCINCGWRMEPEAIERMIREHKGAMKISPGKEEVVTMAQNKSGECLECKKDKTIIGRGLCGACYTRFKNLDELDIRYPIIGRTPRAVKKEVKRPSKKAAPVVEPKTAKEAAQEIMSITGSASPVSDTVIDKNKEPISIEVVFADYDFDLYRDLHKSAAINRRTPSDEILFRLDQFQGAA